VVSYLDRTNVSFAALGMNADLGITAEQFGFGAGMFFIGYFLFEIPSNLIMQKVGARIWIARIMISWGLISMATAFISGPVSFAIARFCLGVAEAGFTPGIYLFFTYWFPWQLARQNHRRVPGRHSGGQYHRLTDFRRADADHRP
jgi:Sugar phosphate permease